MTAAKTKVRSARRPPRLPGQRHEAHELHIRVVGHDPRLGNHLQLTASALAMEARRTGDLRLARILLDACARIAAVARALDRLQAVDRGDRVDVARQLPGICDELRACVWDNAVNAEAESDQRSSNFVAGELVATAVQETTHKGVCVRLDRVGSGRQLSVAPGKGNAGLRMLRAFAARFGESQSAPLPHGASISVLID